MRRRVSGLIVISLQLLIVGLFFLTVFNNDVKVEKYESVVHNENLNKIATSVSLLFKEDKNKDNEISVIEEKLEDYVVVELPSVPVIEEDAQENEEESKLISRHEILASLDDFIRVSNIMLKDKGEFYMIHRPERIIDVLNSNAEVSVAQNNKVLDEKISNIFISIPVALSVRRTGVAVSPSSFASGLFVRIALMMR